MKSPGPVCADDAVASTLVSGAAVLCKRWRKELWLPGPPGSTLRERGTKPLQGASVESGGLERCRKRRRNLRRVCTTKMSGSEPSDDASKEVQRHQNQGDRMPWDELGRQFSFLARWCPA